MKIIQSAVANHLGDCTPTWLNGNAFLKILDDGTTGFFRNVVAKKVFGVKVNRKVGEEFHGIIIHGKVFTTEGMY